MFLAFVCYFLGINAAAALAFAADKRAAVRGEWRISESNLLTLAALGGSSGALAAQQLLRHKTRKEPFRTKLWLIAGTQAILLVGVAYLAS